MQVINRFRSLLEKANVSSDHRRLTLGYKVLKKATEDLYMEISADSFMHPGF